MEEVKHRYEALLCKCILAQSPQVPFFSSVTGNVAKKDAGVLGASYWTQNLVSPVLFFSAVNAISRNISSRKIFLEIGPHSALAGPIRQILRANEVAVEYIPTLIRGGNGQADLLKTAGELWLSNINLDFAAINEHGRFLSDLPSYPWHYENSHWTESRLSKDWRLRQFPHHDLLGSRVIESTTFDPSWRNLLYLDNVTWLQEHEIFGDVIFPGVGYICMTAEAIRQLTGSTDFTVRQVTFNAPLVLHQGPSVEVITHLHQVRLTTTLDSAWYEFSISSLNGSAWIRHCFGQVKAGSEIIKPTQNIGSHKRKVSGHTWYRVMRDLGLEYGPRFSGMSNISTDPIKKVAVATTLNDIREGESFYPIHPVSLDCSLQLFSVAAYHGLPRLFRYPAIPSYIEELHIRPPKGDITMQADADGQPKGALHGDLVAVSEGEIVIDMRGLRLSSIGDSDTVSCDPHAATELVWKSDLNLLDASQLIRPLRNRSEVHSLLDKLGLACVVETYHQLEDIDLTQPHHEKYREWLKTQFGLAVKGRYANVPGCASLTIMDSEERTTLIQKIFEQARDTDAAETAIAIHRVFTCCTDIISGATDALNLLLRDEVLQKLYSFMQHSDFSEFLVLAAHRKPTIRVLEISAGAGSNTSFILPHLRSSYGERMYSSYTYTDSSASFFAAARERFKDYQAMKYVVLDISQDPAEQGFEPESFDLIIACNILHTTPKLGKTLKHVRNLLHPGGRLFLQELYPSTKWINYVMGVLPGWWVGNNDGRVSEPYVSHEIWDSELKDAGFQGIDAISYDGYLNNNMIATPARARKESKRITVLCQERTNIVVEVESELRTLSYEIDYCTTDQTPIPHQDIISLLDVSTPFLHSIDRTRFYAFRDFVTRVKDSGILWVTGATQIACQDPRYALVHGLARTIRNELSIDFATLELETFDRNGWGVIGKVLCEFQDRIQEPEMKCTLEWAYSGGKVQISRYHWISVTEELLEPERQHCPTRLGIDKPGLTNTLHWKQSEPVPLEGDEIEVEVRAIGLNYRV